jgi:hypothetical protein
MTRLQIIPFFTVVLGLQLAEAATVSGLGTANANRTDVVLKASGTATVDYDFAGKRSPKWSGGGLLTVENDLTASPIIRVFGRDGQKLSDLTVTVPRSDVIAVRGIGRGDAGLVVASGRALDSDGRQGSFLVLFQPNSPEEKVIALNEYCAELVAVARDGSVWTAGYAGTPRQPVGDTFKHFDANGKFIGSMVPAGSFSSLLALTNPHNQLTTSGDRLAFFAPSDGRYIEWSSNGSVTADIRTAPFAGNEAVTGFALIDGGRSFLTTQVNARPRRHNLYLFDARSGAARAIAVPDGLTRLLGGQGSDLVGRTAGGALTFFSVQNVQ